MAGKGIAAALMMARLSAAARFCLATTANAAEAVGKLNHDLAHTFGDDRFATFLLAVIDLESFAVTLVNAGHLPPLRCAAGQGAPVPIGEDLAGLPLAGIEFPYEAMTLTLAPGESLLFYTDGVTEARNPAGDLYGVDRLRAGAEDARRRGAYRRGGTRRRAAVCRGPPAERRSDVGMFWSRGRGMRSLNRQRMRHIIAGTGRRGRGWPAQHPTQGARMFRTLPWLAIAALATSLGALVSTAPAAGDKGFVELFDGKDMKGWKFFPEKLQESVKVRDGMIIVSGSPNGYFYTDKSYKNFTLRYDWQYKRPAGLTDEKEFNGNSGLLLFIQGKHTVWPTSVEVQGMNRDAGSLLGVGKVTILNKVFDRPKLEKARHKVGEWNTTAVIVQNGTISVAINGAPVASGSSKLTEGPFGYQSEGAEIHYKNIKIKTMD